MSADLIDRVQEHRLEDDPGWRSRVSAVLGEFSITSREWISRRREHLKRDAAVLASISALAITGFQNRDEIGTAFDDHFNSQPRLEKAAGSKYIDITPAMLYESGFDTSVTGIAAFMLSQEGVSGWNTGSIESARNFVLEVAENDPNITTRTVYTDQETGQTFNSNPIYDEGLQINEAALTEQTVLDFSSFANVNDVASIELPLEVQPAEE